MSQFAIRYIVDNVDETVEFYTGLLGFEVRMRPAPSFAALERDGITLFVNEVGGEGGASQTTSGGERPEPGGWNRFQIMVDDLDAEVARIEGGGGHFRGDVITGKGGRQALLEDPSANLIELFEPFQR